MARIAADASTATGRVPARQVSIDAWVGALARDGATLPKTRGAKSNPVLRPAQARCPTILPWTDGDTGQMAVVRVTCVVARLGLCETPRASDVLIIFTRETLLSFCSFCGKPWWEIGWLSSIAQVVTARFLLSMTPAPALTYAMASRG